MNPVRLRNAETTSVESIPVLAPDAFRSTLLDAVRAGRRISALFALPERTPADLLAVLSHDADGKIDAFFGAVGNTYPALTPDCPQAHLFEREIFEQSGIRPEGHPWLKPVRFPPRPGAPACGEAEFLRLGGGAGHEVAVGPIHAGVIEPGHFRFLCHGETVHHLEISLGYQHRGVERALRGASPARAAAYIETMAGDTTIGHALAQAQAVEALACLRVPSRAHALRAIALELERLANHTGDLGALAGDVGYLPTASFCGRIRGDFLNMTALLCGNRFGRGLLRAGGVRFDLDEARAEDLARRLEAARREVTGAVELLWKTYSVTARFEDTGPLTAEDARTLGLVGPAARACGVETDIRQNHPAGIYRFFQIPISSCPDGDVFARAYVRWLEIQRSLEFIGGQMRALPGGMLRTPETPLQPGRLTVSLVEGWRGEICHVAMTDASGAIAVRKIVDPSFHNWFGLAWALRGQEISDFPLCNKSFNLSYCGFDL